jgi:hypothetical protein
MIKRVDIANHASTGAWRRYLLSTHQILRMHRRFATNEHRERLTTHFSPHQPAYRSADPVHHHQRKTPIHRGSLTTVSAAISYLSRLIITFCTSRLSPESSFPQYFHESPMPRARLPRRALLPSSTTTAGVKLSHERGCAEGKTFSNSAIAGRCILTGCEAGRIREREEAKNPGDVWRGFMMKEPGVGRVFSIKHV